MADKAQKIQFGLMSETMTSAGGVTTEMGLSESDAMFG